MTRRLSLILAAALLAATCAYESSGTTTTTIPIEDESAAPLGPADLVVADQKTEGSSMTVDSISLPADGWVVARADVGGSPGEIVGISELLAPGINAAVPVPFLVPLAATSAIHLAVHIDVDGDDVFLYEPPDSFIDEIAFQANGDPATATVAVTLLPPLSPADAFMEQQVTDGSAFLANGAFLPAPGFIALHLDDAGMPGTVVAISELLPPGDVGETTLVPSPPLTTTGVYHVVAWIDRDEDGLFTPGPDGDEMGIREDGALAASSAQVTVLALTPAVIVASTQESTGGVLVLDEVEIPSPGFIEVLADAAGSPGARLSAAAVPPGTTGGFELPLPPEVASGGTVWLRLWVDFDQDGALSEGDLRAIDRDSGQPVEVSVTFTVS